MAHRLVLQGFLLSAIFFAILGGAFGQEPPVSDKSQDCISCHVDATPALVEDWKKSVHARVTPADALKKPELQRKISATNIPKETAGFVVGCAECHTVNADAHKDAFDHNDVKTHVTVTPKDCGTCHPTEAAQFDKNLMSHAWTNLEKNPLYQSLVTAVNGVQTLKGLKTEIAAPDAKTNAESCNHCHGTAVEVIGNERKSTDMGDMEFPKLSGWPNQGVGRSNPDGSTGTCNPCHSRHQFSLEVARKPYTCSQCHKGPDVPAYKAYSVSKHGNLQSSLAAQWNFKEVPWTVGKDFTAPTCAACHASLLVTGDGQVVAQRTHQMNDRLPWRILGLIYAAPHPISPDTSIIKNKDGIPLPTTFRNEPATEYLIGPEEQAKRRETMQKVCRSCHSGEWVAGHWERFEHTIKTSNQMVFTATQIMTKAWDEKLADNKESLFDEAIEKQWVEHWLFHANSTRFASAMMGADYGVFDSGRWHMSRTIQDMLDHLKVLRATKKRP